MRIPKNPLFFPIPFVLLGAALASTAAADGPSVYAERCASCHGADGRGQTPVGRALGISSFEGRRFEVESVGKLLRESQSHASVDGDAIESELAALVEALNALAGNDDG